MKKFNQLLIIFITLFFVSQASAQTGTITVEVSDINDPKGLISIGVYSNEEGFPDKGKEYKGMDVKVTGKTIACTFKDVVFGTYAIGIFHDTNSNLKFDKNFFGIPTEGYAFSNNVFGVMGTPPDFKDASFQLGGDKTIKIKMEY
ncbi:MAG: DUF2141 domain-containing protein [Deltaproteobacteria bacterium]|nr:DUF2141 domain-containing protein [Deltaproteobacteria bacterium]